MTAEGKALTWVCVIDFDMGKFAYDQLVKPPTKSPIIPPSKFSSDLSFLALNPNPRFSGITATAFDPVTTTLTDMQTHLLTLRKPSTILLSHPLKSDLHALNLSHARYIATALLFYHPHDRLLKPGLAWLTRK